MIYSRTKKVADFSYVCLQALAHEPEQIWQIALINQLILSIRIHVPESTQPLCGLQIYHVSRFQVLSNKKFSFAYDEFVN